MPGDYVTETERVRERLRRTLTPRQKLANWWDYHKKHVCIALLGLWIALYLGAQALRMPDADYSVAWVCKSELDEREAADVAGRLARFGEDLNGDGRVRVELHQIVLDLAALAERGLNPEGQREQGELMALEADLNVCQSVVFLTDDPVSLQACTGALVGLDESSSGTDDFGLDESSSGTNDFGLDELAISWSDCPELGEPAAEGELYLTCRGCWREDQRENWSRGWRLWENILNSSAKGRIDG